MNWGEFEETVRAGMDDTISDHDDGTATWTTVEIAAYTNNAIRDYSQHFPRKRIATIDVVAGTREYDLPVDILNPPDKAIADAQWPRSAYKRSHLIRVDWPSGDEETILISGTGLGYYLWGNQFILADSPTASDASYDITLYYEAVHSIVPEEKGPALYEAEFSVPESDRDLLFWYVTSQMMGKLEASDADLRRWMSRQDGGTNRDDSPPRKSSQFRIKQYQDGITLRKQRRAAPKLRRKKR